MRGVESLRRKDLVALWRLDLWGGNALGRHLPCSRLRKVGERIGSLDPIGTLCRAARRNVEVGHGAFGSGVGEVEGAENETGVGWIDIAVPDLAAAGAFAGEAAGFRVGSFCHGGRCSGSLCGWGTHLSAGDDRSVGVGRSGAGGGEYARANGPAGGLHES